MQEIETLADTLRKIDDIVIKYEQEDRHTYATALPERVEYLIRRYRDLATNQLSGVKAARDDMLVYLRALAMIVEMAGNANTHNEKNARLRGCIELIETTIQKLREQEFNFQFSTWHMPDVFRSDYPTIEYIRRIHQLEEELERVKRDQNGHLPH